VDFNIDIYKESWRDSQLEKAISTLESNK
jgi:hypothetical protein